MLRAAPGWIEIPSGNATSVFKYKDATITVFPDGSWCCVCEPNGSGRCLCSPNGIQNGKLLTPLHDILKELSAVSPVL